jgi:predicted secreted protein
MKSSTYLQASICQMLKWLGKPNLSLPVIKLHLDLFQDKWQSSVSAAGKIMHSSFLTFCLLFSGLAAVNAQSFEWARKITGQYSNTRIQVTPNGNYFVAGQYKSALTIGNFYHCAAGKQDIFVTYYNGQTGEPYWSKRIAGSEDDMLGNISYDASTDHLYITGSFKQSITADNFRAGNPNAGSPDEINCESFLSKTIKSKGGSDIFIAKYYVGTGSLTYFIQAGGIGNDEGFDIKTYKGSTYLTGYFTKEATFNGYTINNQIYNTIKVVADGGYRDAFIAKYHTDDLTDVTKVDWAKQVGTGRGDDYGKAIDVDPWGNIYVTGGFTHNLTFYSNNYQNWTLMKTNDVQGLGDSDMFIVKYNASLNFLWANKAGGSSLEMGNDILVDTDGSIYVSGSYYSSNMAFYHNYKGTSNAIKKVTHGGQKDGFLVKYTYAGLYAWASNLSGSGTDDLTSIAKDNTGKLYVAGGFLGTAIAYGPFNLKKLNSTGGVSNKDIAIIRYTLSGQVVETMAGGGVSDNDAHSMGIDKNNHIIFSGYGTANAVFGAKTLNSGGTYTVKISAPVKPTAPSNFQATAVGPHQINLAWVDGANEKEYILERKEINTTYKAIKVLPANTTTFSDNSLKAGTNYFYQIRAVNGTESSANIYANTTTWATSFYRAINLNGNAITIDGNNWEGKTAPNYAYTGNTFANQNIALFYSTDANRATMIRSSIYGTSPSVTIKTVPNGTYDIYLYVWEDTKMITAPTYNVVLEGTVVKKDFVVNAPNEPVQGNWRKLGPFTKTISDGTIQVSTNGGEANLSGIEIYKVATPSNAKVDFAQEVSTQINPNTEEDLSQLLAYPVPAQEKVTFQFALALTGKASLQVYDLSGHLVATLFEGEAEGGRNYQLEMAASRLEPGMYIAKLSSFNKSQHTKIIITR